jgi:hypothetical protein
MSLDPICFQFNLVCQRSILRSITAMMFYPGMLFGGLIGGNLADRYRLVSLSNIDPKLKYLEIT